jgi:hypothetical protein
VVVVRPAGAAVVRGAAVLRAGVEASGPASEVGESALVVAASAVSAALLWSAPSVEFAVGPCDIVVACGETADAASFAVAAAEVQPATVAIAMPANSAGIVQRRTVDSVC